MATNKETFQAELTAQYTHLFKTADYAFARARNTPEQLAEKMTNSLATGSANKDGEGIKNTCKKLGIKYTYGAIENYLNGKA